MIDHELPWGLIDAAARAGDSPDRAIVRIGRRPWIDTAVVVDRLAVRAADFIADSDCPARFADPRLASRAMYWGRSPPEADGVRIAGLLWEDDGPPRAFQARLLAP